MSDKLETIPEDWNMPEWVKWIAIDGDGCCFGYRDKPLINKKYREWIGSTYASGPTGIRYIYQYPREVPPGNVYGFLSKGVPPKDYTQELYKVIWTYE